jgi:hypothetical protein
MPRSCRFRRARRRARFRGPCARWRRWRRRWWWEYTRNMEENMQQNAEYAKFISWHIMHILHIPICIYQYEKYAYYDDELLFCTSSISSCILLHIISHILHILHIEMCRISKISTGNYFVAHICNNQYAEYAK